MRRTSPVKSCLPWCALAVLVGAGPAWGMGPGMFMFDFHGSPMPYNVQMHVGEQHSFQFCATAEVVNAAHQTTWPGTPLTVGLTWSQTVKGSNTEAIPWPGPNNKLPLQTQMTGPIADGRYCSKNLVVNYGSFPNNGVWHLRAHIEGTQIGTLSVNWTLQPPMATLPANRGAVMAKPKAVIPPGGLSGQSQGQGQQQALPNRLRLPAR